MSKNDEIILFDLSSFGFPLKDTGKQLYDATKKSIGSFSKRQEGDSGLVEINVLISQTEAILREMHRMKAERETMVVSEENPYLNVDEVAQILRVSPETVREEIDSGRIRAVKIGRRGQNKILKSDLAKFLGVTKIIFTQKDISTASSH
ncbi:MAG TPA: helix-turn-helix domain-containing protein [Candidatus Cloacimonadota bacterium]|nr:helix-turn-helix domain-containing protein [Candidatus Cloacimonadota bacterium]